MALQYFDEAAIGGVLRMQQLIPAMRQAMIDYSRGRVVQPTRRAFAVPGQDGMFASMPAAGAGTLGAKLVTVYPGNAVCNLHTHHAVIVLFRPDTGEPLAALDGRLITEMRTAAATAAFVDAVAPAGARSLAILGAGTQGRSHAAALPLVRRFDDVRVWSRTASRAAALAEVVGGRALDRELAVRDADVVVVATASSEPVLEGAWLRPGATVASVGWAGADGAELDAATMANVVVVDSRAGAEAESGNVRRHRATIFAELGEVLDGSRVPPAHSTVVFDSIGMACQDLAAASLAFAALRGQDCES